ncbi:MAG: hypothetical protein JWL85_204, partial [Candidatus Saccharibacteria bacterium]|nr:hypothetical protein [Candidatus Saccharibacteria bacterium]
MEQKSSNKYLMRFIGALFIGFGLWWLYIAVFQRHVDPYNAVGNQSFSSTYGLMSLFGGLIGISASTSWGGHKSLIGRSLLFFSIGLLAQEFGQLAYSFYLYALQVKIPYPSVGDVGYLSSALFYIYASYLLLQANGARFSLKDRNKRIISVVLPLVLLGASYTFFLRDYQFDFST